MIKIKFFWCTAAEVSFSGKENYLPDCQKKTGLFRIFAGKENSLHRRFLPA
jgi:hypothetical protein